MGPCSRVPSCCSPILGVDGGRVRACVRACMHCVVWESTFPHLLVLHSCYVRCTFFSVIFRYPAVQDFMSRGLHRIILNYLLCYPTQDDFIIILCYPTTILDIRVEGYIGLMINT